VIYSCIIIRNIHYCAHFTIAYWFLKQLKLGQLTNPKIDFHTDIIAPITSLNFYFSRSLVNFVKSGNPFYFFFKNKKIETKSGKQLLKRNSYQN